MIILLQLSDEKFQWLCGRKRQISNSSSPMLHVQCFVNDKRKLCFSHHHEQYQEDCCAIEMKNIAFCVHKETIAQIMAQG
jgi:hypothetical protein